MQMSDGQIRFLGLISMLAGLAMLLASGPEATPRAFRARCPPRARSIGRGAAPADPYNSAF